MRKQSRTEGLAASRGGMGLGLILALMPVIAGGPPALGQEAVGDGPALGGVQAGGGVKAAAVRPIRQIVIEAMPAVAGAKVIAPVRSKGAPKISGLNRQVRDIVPSRKFRLGQAKFPFRHAKIPGWPRIPDLPQVKAKIATTNGVKSRFDMQEQSQPAPVTGASGGGAPATGAFDVRTDPRRSDARDRSASSGSHGGSSGSPAAAPAQAAPSMPAAAPRQIASPGVDDVRRLVREQNETPLRLDERFLACPPCVCRPPGSGFDGIAPVYVEDEPEWAAEEAAAAAEPAPLPPTTLEIADAWLAEGDPTQAAAAYLEHIETATEDGGAVRSLALAVLMAGRPEQATELVVRAYLLDPTLVDRPIDPGALPRGDSTLRELVRDAVKHANRFPSAEAWLMTAVLMQGEGRHGVAMRMLDRAKRAGLDAGLATGLRTAMTP